MKNTFLFLFGILIFVSCKKKKEEIPIIPKRTAWDTVYVGSNLDFRQEFYAIDNTTGVLAVNSPTTVKLLTTTDGGKNWTETDTKLTTLEVRSVAFQTRDIGYVSLFNKGVFKTADGGKNWEKINDGTCALTADQNSLTILTGYKSLYSTDKGVTFTEEPAEFTSMQNPVTSFRFGNNVYFYFHEGMIKSQNGGKTWENADLSFSNISSIIPINSSKWFLISNTALFKTEDAGKTWAQVDKEKYNYLGAAKGDTLFVNRANKIQSTKDGITFSIDDEVIGTMDMFSIGNNTIGFGNDMVYRRKY